MRKAILWTLAALAVVAVCTAHAQKRAHAIKLTIGATGWHHNGQPMSSAPPVYPFMCMTSHLRETEDECWGFRRRDEKNTAGIYGIGITNSEFSLMHDFRFTNIQAAVGKPVTFEQEKQVMSLVNSWDAKRPELTMENCLQLINEIAKTAGFKAPDKPGANPDQYLQQLRQDNPSFLTSPAPSGTRIVGE
jgi:hypothetical protein